MKPCLMILRSSISVTGTNSTARITAMLRITVMLNGGLYGQHLHKAAFKIFRLKKCTQ